MCVDTANGSYPPLEDPSAAGARSPHDPRAADAPGRKPVRYEPPTDCAHGFRFAPAQQEPQLRKGFDRARPEGRRRRSRSTTKAAMPEELSVRRDDRNRTRRVSRTARGRGRPPASTAPLTDCYSSTPEAARATTLLLCSTMRSVARHVGDSPSSRPSSAPAQVYEFADSGPLPTSPTRSCAWAPSQAQKRSPDGVPGIRA
jgi:hypothetical protein